MKVPVPITTTTLTTPTTYTINNNSSSSYEPASVLDLQCGASLAIKPSSGNNLNDDRRPTAELDNLEGWDSILCELGLNDDNNYSSHHSYSKLLFSNNISPPPHRHHSQVLSDFASSQPFDHSSDFSYTPNFGPLDQHLQNTITNNNNINTLALDFLDDLVRAAHAFESNDSHQFHVLLTRLNQRLRSPVGKPLQRAAYYFKEALQHLSNNHSTTTTTTTRPAKLSSYDVVQTIRATKAFSGISPISLFSAFAANQAILEAVDGASFIHIVDFDIGFGGHWASFMRELVDKTIDNLPQIVLIITAIVQEEFGVECKLLRENLSQFARELNLNFHIDFVLIPTFEILSFKSVKFIDGEKIAVHLSPSVFHRLANSNLRSGISKFVAELRGVAPSAVVVVDKEVGIDVGTTSFGVSFVAGIEYFTGLMESLDMAAAGGFNGGEDYVRKIETFVLRPKIVSAVEAAATAAGRRGATWRESFAAAGMRVVGFSQFADFQAECLLRRAQVGGFHVAKRHGEMMLFWHDRPLVATSAWKC
ncbi:hypothetical protein RND81_02G156800 [Saponaria officinalis]|uniref:Scarecrow-like protein 15 n=1 Tax=Saponaria officinalis TaxID=3572 RepID=A0AAW1MY91_SAPOF